MKAKAVVPRELANRDVEEAIGYYLSEATVQVALGFVDALEHAYACVFHAIADTHFTGSRTVFHGKEDTVSG